MSGRRRHVFAVWALLTWLMLPAVLPAGSVPERQVHGESSSFIGHGVAMVWGVLRGVTEEGTRVVLRVVPTGSNYAAVSVDGLDPFTQRRQSLLGRQPLGKQRDLLTSRATFAEFPRREIHLFTAEQPTQRPSLTVYFMGLPDTTPEFTSEAALRKYLDDTVAKLLAEKGRTP
jgi:hypothetical protein